MLVALIYALNSGRRGLLIAVICFSILPSNPVSSAATRALSWLYLKLANGGTISKHAPTVSRVSGNCQLNTTSGYVVKGVNS